MSPPCYRHVTKKFGVRRTSAKKKSGAQSTTENTRYFPRATPVDKRPPHTSATPFLASLRRPALYQPHFGTNGSEQTGLPSWKVAWSYVENFSSYSRSKLIKVDQLFRGVFKRSSNRNTYRNEAFKDIFSCRGKKKITSTDRISKHLADIFLVLSN